MTSKKLIYLFIFLSTFGSSIIGFRVFGITLSPFRIALLLVFLLTILKRRSIIIFYNAKNKFSICFFSLWVAYSLISFFWSYDKEAWLKSCFFVLVGTLSAIILVNWLINESDIVGAFKIFSFGVLVQELFGYYEIITGNYFFLGEGSVQWYQYAKLPVAMCYNTNDFATLMVFGVVSSFICFKAENKNNIEKLCYLFVFIGAIALVFFSQSRANILGLLVMAIIYILLTQKNKFRLLILIAIVILCNTSVFSLVLNSMHIDLHATSGSDYERLNLIKNGLLFVKDTLGFGVGAGQIEYWMKNYGVYPTLGIYNMHNYWIEILTSSGIIVFMLFVRFYIQMFKNAYSIYKKDNTDYVSLGVMLLLAGFSIASISSSSNMNNEWLWCMWGILITWQGISEEKKISNE